MTNLRHFWLKTLVERQIKKEINDSFETAHFEEMIEENYLSQEQVDYLLSLRCAKVKLK